MKLVAVEGPNEATLYNIVLERNLFVFTKVDLLTKKIEHCRQLEQVRRVYEAVKRFYGKPIEVLRLGDKLEDKFKIPKDVELKIKKEIKDYNVLPELEVLFILKEGLYKEFQKAKTKLHQKAHIFATIHISHRGKKYDGTSKWIEEYMNDLSDHDIYEMFRMYSENCSRNPRCKNNILSLLKRI